MYKFTGCFAGLMEDFILFKETHGYSRGSYENTLADFDLFCISHCIEEAALTDKLVLEWMTKRPDESVSGLKRRTQTIRQFGKYLSSVGIPSYVVPEDFIIGNSSFIPYIFSDTELTSFFSAVDSSKPSPVNPFKPLVLAVMFHNQNSFPNAPVFPTRKVRQ